MNCSDIGSGYVFRLSGAFTEATAIIEPLDPPPNGAGSPTRETNV